MKKILAIIASAAILGSCSNGKKYTVKGADESLENGKYAYLYIDNNNEQAVDSVLIADNSFVLKGGGELELPVAATIVISEQGAGKRGSSTGAEVLTRRRAKCSHAQAIPHCFP